MVKYKSKVARVLLFMMLLTGFIGIFNPNTTYASINHGTGLGNSTPSGDGNESWVYPGEGAKPYGMRISIYFAPSLEVFNGTAGDKYQIRKIGQTREFTTYMPSEKYATQHSTGRSAIDYMAFGKELDIRYHEFVDGGYNRTIGGPIVAKMPNILNSSTEEWRTFFAGSQHATNPDYTTVSEILKEMGVDLSKEDFKNGIYKDDFGNTQSGVYKLFFEPVGYFRVGGYNSAFTMHDLGSWEQKFAVRRNNRDVAAFYKGPTSSDIANQNTVVIPNTGNSHFLSEDEPALGMKAKPSGYIIPKASSEQRNAVQKGATAWLSNGIGVLTTKPSESPNTLISTYVELVDVVNGKPVFKKVAESEEEPLETLMGTNYIMVDIKRQKDNKKMILNDIAVATKDINKKADGTADDITKVKWEEEYAKREDRTESVTKPDVVTEVKNVTVSHPIMTSLLKEYPINTSLDKA